MKKITALFLITFSLLSPNAILADSGEEVPVGDVPGWKQIFVDDFTTDVPVGQFPEKVSDKWMAYQDGWQDTSKNGTYYPSKVVSIHDGVMDLFLHTEDGLHMVAAPVPILAPGKHDYGSGLSAGRYVVRFKADPIPCYKLPQKFSTDSLTNIPRKFETAPCFDSNQESEVCTGSGYKTAWLLWPDSERWPKDGEIDFPEGNLDGTISAFMHRQNGRSVDDQDAYSTNATYSTWHTAVTEWLPESQSLKFYLDGQLIGHSTSRVPNTPMHWVLQTETSLSGCIPADSTSGHVLIDWVAVYTPAQPAIEAENMSLSENLEVVNDSQASNGKYLKFLNNTSTSTTFTNQTKIRKIIISASGDQCTRSPKMEIRIDGKRVLSSSVRNTNWTEYSKSLNLTPGIHTLTISYDNEYTRNGCNTNLMVDKITFK